jgi:septum site-determining protein MinC
MMLRGTAAGLEFVFDAGPFEAASVELCTRIAARADFYRGSAAAAIFAGGTPPEDAFVAFLSAVRGHGIELRGLYGDAETAALAGRQSLAYLGEPPRASEVASIERRRAARAERPAPPETPLTEGARSLNADFAGARADLAARRARRVVRAAPPPLPGNNTAAAAATPTTATLYHRGTLRGGQALQHVGNIVVVGDVNPGAELVAGGDILVFGALRGTAHAGATGDANARVAALELAATQLRIATAIASGDGRKHALGPEEAHIDKGRIAIVPFARGRNVTGPAR